MNILDTKYLVIEVVPAFLFGLHLGNTESMICSFHFGPFVFSLWFDYQV